MSDLAVALRAALEERLPAAVELRHRLHADPRVSGDEGDTARAVVEALGHGDGRSVAATGRVVLCGAERHPARSIALRAELDALPIAEHTGVPWAATSGVMHACGHDVHLAGLVAAAGAITQVGAPTPVVALLQPREEAAPSGAREVVESGLLDDLAVGAVVAAHVQPHVPLGAIAITPGLVNASVDEIRIEVTGSGGHVGYPHTLADPVLALGAIVVSLQQISARRVDPTRGAVCVVTEVRAGNTANVIPGKAYARGTLRLLDAGDRTRMVAEIHDIVGHTAAAYHCTALVDVVDGEPALHNDPALAAAAGRNLTEQGTNVVTDFRSFGADDFAYYCERGPALMAFVGVGEPGGPGLHEAGFLPADAMVGAVAGLLISGYLAAL